MHLAEAPFFNTNDLGPEEVLSLLKMSRNQFFHRFTARFASLTSHSTISSHFFLKEQKKKKFPFLYYDNS